MTPDELKQGLRTLGLTQEEFGALVYSARRTVVYWTSSAVPGPVDALMSVLLERPEIVEVLRAIAAKRGAV